MQTLDDIVLTITCSIRLTILPNQAARPPNFHQLCLGLSKGVGLYVSHNTNASGTLAAGGIEYLSSNRKK